MSLRHLVILRQLSTCRVLRQSFLSENYKSKSLWDTRYSCNLLSGDDSIIRSINSKIIMGQDLNSLEVDMFTNIARSGDVAQLQESVKLLEKFRKSLYAHTLLPSTPHAICRLFLYSQRLSSLINILENRVNYGVFPDFFALNLLLDDALDKENYAFASRIASLVMFQEEFGFNHITDVLALTAVSKYVESKTDFSDWLHNGSPKEPILTGQAGEVGVQDEGQENCQESKEQEAGEDEEEEEVEYIRVPFLRNPYFDNHFDITNPRMICGKTFSMLGRSHGLKDQNLGVRCRFFGSLLQGKWSELAKILKTCQESKVGLGPIKELLEFYMTNLNEVVGPSDEEKESFMSSIEKVSQEGGYLRELAEANCETLSQYESQDIEQLKRNIVKWSEIRSATKKALEDREIRRKLIEEVRAKKLELEQKEQYLYFYDNLKKSRLTRIDYS